LKAFYLPTEIITGLGCFDRLGEVASRYGENALLVCGKKAMKRTGILDRALKNMAEAGMMVTVYDGVGGEPTLDMVEEGLALARREGSQVVIGLGGGSAMDAAKAIAGLFFQPGKPQEYHRGRPVEGPGLPFIAIPTTAGTGAEVTKNAVLIDRERGVKGSIRSEQWFAKVALVDPELTLSLPPSVTASTGSDALCQAIESYVSIGAMPTTDALATQAIALIGRSLVRAYHHGQDIDDEPSPRMSAIESLDAERGEGSSEARSDMLYGSLLAGMALSNARLGGVHGIAHPLGCRYNIPHGVICGLLLPYLMEYNLGYALDKYAHIAQLLGEDTRGMATKEAAIRSIEAVRRILKEIGIPMRLRLFGVEEADFPAIIAQSLPSDSLKHNPRPLGEDDVRLILERAM